MAKGITTTIKINGFKELKKFVDQLPKRAVKKATRAGVSAGITPIAKAVRKGAPTESKFMRKSVSRKVRTFSDGNTIGLIGANKATTGSFNGRKRVPANYWHLVIGGTQPHSQPKAKRQHPGAKANDFLRDGFNATAPQAASIMQKKMNEVLMREAAKLRGK